MSIIICNLTGPTITQLYNCYNKSGFHFLESAYTNLFLSITIYYAVHTKRITHVQTGIMHLLARSMQISTGSLQ